MKITHHKYHACARISFSSLRYPIATSSKFSIKTKAGARSPAYERQPPVILAEARRAESSWATAFQSSVSHQPAPRPPFLFFYFYFFLLEITVPSSPPLVVPFATPLPPTPSFSFRLSLSFSLLSLPSLFSPFNLQILQ